MECMVDKDDSHWTTISTDRGRLRRRPRVRASTVADKSRAHRGCFSWRLQTQGRCDRGTESNSEQMSPRLRAGRRAIKLQEGTSPQTSTDTTKDPRRGHRSYGRTHINGQYEDRPMRPRFLASAVSGSPPPNSVSPQIFSTATSDWILRRLFSRTFSERRMGLCSHLEPPIPDLFVSSEDAGEERRSVARPERRGRFHIQI